LQESIDASQAAVKGNKVGYKLGLRINSDVLTSEQQLYENMRDLARTKYDALLDGLKLEAAAGGLSESDVISVNRLLTASVPIK